MLATPIARLRTIGLIESLSSFVLFFIAVPIKWVPFLIRISDGMPADKAMQGLVEMPVKIVGMTHGILFCIYILAVVLAVRSPGLPPKVIKLAFVAAILPFPFSWLILDPKLKAHEQLLAANPQSQI